MASLPGGWLFYILMSITLMSSIINTNVYVQDHPGACYLGNTTGEQRYEQHSYICGIVDSVLVCSCDSSLLTFLPLTPRIKFPRLSVA